MVQSKLKKLKLKRTKKNLKMTSKFMLHTRCLLMALSGPVSWILDHSWLGHIILHRDGNKIKLKEQEEEHIFECTVTLRGEADDTYVRAFCRAMMKSGLPPLKTILADAWTHNQCPVLVKSLKNVKPLSPVLITESKNILTSANFINHSHVTLKKKTTLCLVE